MTPSFCAAPATDRFAARLLADTDCQAFGLVERGYAALAQPGGTVSTALTGLLVIAVAFFGYRLLLGRGLGVSDSVALAVKIGVVLLIATSWESWQALAYNGLARAPSQVASELLAGIGAPPPLESLQQALDNLTSATVGYRQRAGIASPLVGGPAAAAAVLNIAAMLLTLSTVGILVVMRVVLAVLLAIAPAIAGLILFRGTRGMAQAWVGVMAAAALAPLFILTVAAVEFAIMAPMIDRLLEQQAAGSFANELVMPIGLVAIVFTIAIIVAVRAGSRIGLGVRLPRFDVGIPARDEPAVEMGRSVDRERLATAPSETPRVSRALESIARRDVPARSARTQLIGASRASSTARDSRAAAASPGESGTIAFPPQQRQSRMRSAPRRSRAASRRDA